MADPDHEKAGAECPSSVFFALLDEDSPFEELFFFFITNLMNDGDGFMAIRYKRESSFDGYNDKRITSKGMMKTG